MRKAVLILSIILMVIVLFQAYMVGVGGQLFNDMTLAQGGLFGRIVAILFGLGAAFVLGKPKVSVVIFGLGGLTGVVSGIVTDFNDLILWGVFSLGLGVMSFFADREADRAPSSMPDEKIRAASEF